MGNNKNNKDKESDVLNKYRLIKDLHTHTIYSHCLAYHHGKGTVMDNVEAAVNLGLEEISISDHGLGHKIYGIKLNDLPDLRKDIAEAREKFPDIKINLSIEADFIDTPNGLDVAPEEFGEFDFIIAGYHYGCPGGRMVSNFISHCGLFPSGSTESLRVHNTDIVLRALYSNDIRIITHPCDKGPFDIKKICEACEATDTIMEINARHAHLTVEEIRCAMDYNVRFIINSDAHKPCDVGRCEDGILRAAEAGLDFERVVNVVER